VILLAALALSTAAMPAPASPTIDDYREMLPRLAEPIAKFDQQRAGAFTVGLFPIDLQINAFFGPAGALKGRLAAGDYLIWRWASVTKQVVAVLVMQEVEKGRIDLDAPATKYLPGVVLPGGDAVTVRLLLNHTSGLYDPNSGPAAPDGTPLAYLRSKTPAPKGLDQQCLKPSGRAPGEGFVYNNCDYVVLGALLEQVTAKPFATLVQERIAKPLRLKSLRVLKPGDHDDIVGVDDKGATDAQIDPGRYGSAANLAGTSNDLLKFDRALMGNKLLGKVATAEMWKGDPKLGYAALGAWSYPVTLRGCTAAQQIVERRGQVGNVQVRNIIAPERGIVVIAFASYSETDFGEPWQGKGLSYELLSAALCPEAHK
jgi:CubicO group peptidase (beta-lactamase class C family)